jgi:hypothetical protein
VNSYRQKGAVYLLCWAATPYKHAGHYLGFAYPDSPERADTAILAEVAAAVQTKVTGRQLTAVQAAGVAHRVGQHRTGTGARLLAVITGAGISFTITRVWAGATEGHEKWIKDLNNRSRLCPHCNPGTTAGTAPRTKRFRRARKMRTAPAA